MKSLLCFLVVLYLHFVPSRGADQFLSTKDHTRTSGQCSWTALPHVDLNFGDDLEEQSFPAASVEVDCQGFCLSRLPLCTGYSIFRETCYLKQGTLTQTVKFGVLSGIRNGCDAPAVTTTTPSPPTTTVSPSTTTLPPSPPPVSCTWISLPNTDVNFLVDLDYQPFPPDTVVEDCRAFCVSQRPACSGYSIFQNTCYLKAAPLSLSPNSGVLSGSLVSCSDYPSTTAAPTSIPTTSVPPVGRNLGVNYAFSSTRSFSEREAFAILRSSGFFRIKTFEIRLNKQLGAGPPPESDLTLPAIRAEYGNGARVWVGLENQLLPRILQDAQFRVGLVAILQTYEDILLGVCLGNEPFQNGVDVGVWGSAFDALRADMDSAGMEAPIVIPISTCCVFENTYPPSAAQIAGRYVESMRAILSRMNSQRGGVAMVNLYPYFARLGNPRDISLDYAVGILSPPAITPDGQQYDFIWDALHDAARSAIDRLDFGAYSGLPFVVGETGWPTDGGPDTSVPLAQTHYRSVLRRSESNAGTPLYPGEQLDVFHFRGYQFSPMTSFEPYFALFDLSGTPVIDVSS